MVYFISNFVEMKILYAKDYYNNFKDCITILFLYHTACSIFIKCSRSIYRWWKILHHAPLLQFRKSHSPFYERFLKTYSFFHKFRGILKCFSRFHYPHDVVKEVQFELRRHIIGFTGSLNFKGTALEQLTLLKILRYCTQQIQDILKDANQLMLETVGYKSTEIWWEISTHMYTL